MGDTGRDRGRGERYGETIRNHHDVLQELNIRQRGDRATTVVRERAPQNSR